MTGRTRKEKPIETEDKEGNETEDGGRKIDRG